jgi:cardiolipin synthase
MDNDTQWKFYTEAQACWDDMLADIRAARVSIDLEQYIFTLDEIGFKFIEALIEKAQQGLRVRVLCDWSGSVVFASSELRLDLVKKGVQVIFYNPISYWRLYNFSSWFFRDHRKITVIDSMVAYTGSLGIKTVMSDWRDTHVRIIGPVVDQIKNAFEQMWLAAKEDKKFFKFKKMPGVEGQFVFLINSPYQRNRFIQKAFTNAIKNAKRYVYLTTPYFIPDLGFFRALLAAAKRKIDVRLLLPGKSDHKALDIASASYIGLAIRAGVKVFLYNKDRFMHAKTAIIDDTWSTIGSANLDNLSFRYSYEGNIVSANPQFITELKNHFLTDLQNSSLVAAEAWSKRPVKDKILEALSWPIHNFF